jgi:hypothetical protein
MSEGTRHRWRPTEKVILKWTSNKQGMMMWIARMSPVVGCCEYDNNPSDYMKPRGVIA